MNFNTPTKSLDSGSQIPALRALTTRALYHHRDSLRPFPVPANVTPFPRQVDDTKVSYVPFVIRRRAILRSA